MSRDLSEINGILKQIKDHELNASTLLISKHPNGAVLVIFASYFAQ